MPDSFTQSELESFLDEALPAEDMARIEKALRKDKTLAGRLASVHGRRNSGVHSLGDIWRRARVSCPTREQLGSYLLHALGDDLADYVEFHLRTVGCRYCQANLADLEAQQAETADTVETRRRRFFQSSAGLLRKGEGGI
jgi:hypothetical protein